MNPDTLYLRNDLHIMRARPGQCVVTLATTGLCRAVPTSAARALARCQGLEAFDGHVRRVCEAEGASAGTAIEALKARIREDLTCCIERGVLVSWDEVRHLLRGRQQVRALPVIDPVAVLSRDRPSLLKRCLGSYLENMQRHDRPARVLVMDDSVDAANIRRNEIIVASLRRHFGREIDYFGSRDARHLESRLTRAGFDPEVVRFALFGESPWALGANRNRLLLQTVGRRAVCIDDDTICEWRAHARDRGWTLESEDVSDVRLYPERATALRADDPDNLDFIALYDHVLGSDPATLLARTDPAVPLHAGRTLKPATLARLLRAGGRVAYCMPGLVGDCATWAPYYLMLNGESRERLLETEATYRAGTTYRDVMRCVPTYTLSPAGVCCMGYAVGIDNTRSLPPFLPLGRNSDGLFASTLAVCEPAAFKVDFPHAVIHDPLPGRRFAADITAAYSSCRIAETVGASMALAGEWPKHHGPERRLAAVGTYLCEIAGLSAADFDDALRAAVDWQFKSRVRMLECALAQYRESPDYWARDVISALGNLQEALTRPGPVWPLDVPPQSSDEDRRAVLRRIVGLFGRLLVEWQALREFAALVADAEC